MEKYIAYIPAWQAEIEAKSEREAFEIAGERFDEWKDTDPEADDIKIKPFIELDDAQHPARQKAIRIIDEAEIIFGREINGEKYYELEDIITNIIAK